MYYWVGKDGEYLHVLGVAIPPLVDKTKPDPKSKIKKGALSRESIEAFKKDGRIVSLKKTAQTGANKEAQKKLDEEEAKRKALEDAGGKDGQSVQTETKTPGTDKDDGAGGK